MTCDESYMRNPNLLTKVLSHGDFCLPNVLAQGDSICGFIDLGRAGVADKWQDIALCYRSLQHNFDGTYGSSYEGFEPGALFEVLGIEPDWEKIRYYLYREGTEQLKNLPEAMILNREADVLRDEGEAFARKLRDAGVPVTAMRFQGMIHDFVMLHTLDQTRACRAAMDASVSWINMRNQKAIH